MLSDKVATGVTETGRKRGVTTTDARRGLAPALMLCVLIVAAIVVNQWGIISPWPRLSTAGQLLMSATATVLVVLYTTGLTRVLGGVGMLGCFAGDLVPRFIEAPTTDLAMIAAFAVGQLFLVAAFWVWVDWRAPRTKLVAGVLVAYAVGILSYLAVAPGVERALLGPVALYAVLLVLMAVTASVHPVALVGAMAFIISDSILALKILGLIDESVPTSSTVMGFYGLALLLLSIGLVLQDRRAPRS